MKNTEPMTLKEGLEKTHDILAGISVPIALLQQIGVPIMNAMENLRNMAEACEAAANGPEEPEEGPEGPEEEPEDPAIREEDL